MMHLVVRRASPILALLLLGLGSRLDGQSNLSTQGFGYPTGQLSARAYATGGSIAEMDPLSPINPASISLIGTRLLFFQIEPEYRTVSTASGAENTTTARYPVVFGALPVGTRWMFSASSSSLLDRTATTVFNSTQFLTPVDSVPMTTRYQVAGGINDLRLATAFTPASWLHLGLGLHGITGSNLINITQSFVDSAQFATFTQTRVLGYSGTAISAGAMLVSKDFTAAFSGRYGGPLHLLSGDTIISVARVPNQFGATLAYTGIANSAIAVRTSREDWSSVGNLGTPAIVGVDAWDTSVGAEIAGPRSATRVLFLRGGFRTRTLPFQASGQTVRENSVTGGLGTTFANSHILTDLAVIYADRSAAVDASEHAWTVSIGISVRP